MAFPEDLEICQILLELIPHLPEAKADIEITVQELKRGSVINWGNIRIILKQLLYRRVFSINLNEYGFPYTFPCPQNFEKFIFSILTLFDMRKCSDKSIIADVLELLCLSRYNDTSSIESYETSIDIRLNASNGQPFMSPLEKSLVFSFKGLSPFFPPISESERTGRNWIKMLVSFGDVKLLKVIISYGATLIMPMQSTYMWNTYGLIMQLFRKTNYNFRMMELAGFVYSFEQNWMKLDEHSRKRQSFVWIVLNSIFQDASKTDKYIQCARIIMNSMPEPLITSDEVKSFFTKLCSGIVSNEQMLQFVEEYESHFPESRGPSTPRTLKHLSRFQVRESLRTAKSFPYGVQLLGVPKKVQDCICLKDILL